MAAKQIADGLFMLSGFVNVYLLDVPEGLTLVDAGFPKSEGRILEAISGLGRAPGDLKHVVLTHAHPDHIGSLAAVVRATGARTFMHPLDIRIAESGGPFRPMTPAPGLLPGLVFRMLIRPDTRVEPTRIDHPMADGDVLPIGGGLKVVHCPGHCAGQVALLWQDRAILFAGDACSNIMGPSPPIGYEDRAEGERSQRKLAALRFDMACFGHGGPIRTRADARFRKVWG